MLCNRVIVMSKVKNKRIESLMDIIGSFEDRRRKREDGYNAENETSEAVFDGQ
jgi:hypothetical protein